MPLNRPETAHKEQHAPARRTVRDDITSMAPTAAHQGDTFE